MESLTVSRTIDASTESVRTVIDDVEPFMRAAGFDQVEVEDGRITIVNGFALAAIELVCEEVPDDEAVLAYEQADGIFEEMETRYVLTSTDGGTEVAATTDFALDVSIVGGFLDATVIKRQRRRELDSQLDYLQSAVAEG